MSEDGKLRKTLFQHSSVNTEPVWSPGGRKIAFVSTRDGNPEIYVMNADRSHESRLTFDAGDDNTPAFTISGTQIRFIRGSGVASQLYVMNTDGSDQQLVGTFAGDFASWSPGGTRIAYSAFAGSATGLDIWVANPDGSNPVDVSQLPGDELHSWWSVDGSEVVFDSQTGDQIAPADGSAAPGQFTFGGIVQPQLGPYVPVFAPDGNALAYRFDSGLARVLHADGSVTKLIDNVSSPTPIAWQPSSVEIDTNSPTTIDYGDTVPLTLRLYWGDQTDNDVVSLYRKTDGPDVLVGQGTVDANGDLPLVVKPSRKTTYVLKWTGDTEHEASTSVFPLLIQVHAEALAFLSHAYGRDGKYRLYHVGHLVPITGTVLPKHHKDLWFEVDRLDGKHRWRYVDSEPFSLGRKGVVAVVFHSDRIGRYRVRTSFHGDKDHLKDVSPWAYFKITA